MLLYVQQPDRIFKILLCLAVKISFFTNLLNKSLFIWLNTNFGDHQSKRLNSNLVSLKSTPVSLVLFKVFYCIKKVSLPDTEYSKKNVRLPHM